MKPLPQSPLERSHIDISESTFAPTLRLLDASLRRDLVKLYGALRKLDDLIDDQRPEAAERLTALEIWTMGAESDSEEVDAFVDLECRGLRREPVATFCQAMKLDLAGEEFDSEYDLDTYCRLGSGSIAIMAAQLIGETDERIERGMETLGTAIQRAHILRDLDVDREMGRIYIPAKTIERFGSIDPGSRSELMKYEIERADAMFDKGITVIRALPRARRWVAASARLYREILREIERNDYGAHPGRAKVARWRQHSIVIRSLMLPR